MAAVTICSDFGAQKNKVWHCFHCFPIYLPWSDGTRCHDLRFLNVKYTSMKKLSKEKNKTFLFLILSLWCSITVNFLEQGNFGEYWKNYSPPPKKKLGHFILTPLKKKSLCNFHLFVFHICKGAYHFTGGKKKNHLCTFPPYPPSSEHITCILLAKSVTSSCQALAAVYPHQPSGVPASPSCYTQASEGKGSLFRDVLLTEDSPWPNFSHVPLNTLPK